MDKCICPSCGRAYDGTVPDGWVRYIALGRVIMLCHECSQLKPWERAKIMAKQCKRMRS